MKGIDLCSTVGQISEVVCNVRIGSLIFVIFSGAYPVILFRVTKTN
jgi:hypothetical protein